MFRPPCSTTPPNNQKTEYYMTSHKSSVRLHETQSQYQQRQNEQKVSVWEPNVLDFGMGVVTSNVCIDNKLWILTMLKNRSTNNYANVKIPQSLYNVLITSKLKTIIDDVDDNTDDNNETSSDNDQFIHNVCQAAINNQHTDGISQLKKEMEELKKIITEQRTCIDKHDKSIQILFKRAVLKKRG